MTASTADLTVRFPSHRCIEAIEAQRKFGSPGPDRFGDPQCQAHGGVHRHGERHAVGPVDIVCVERVEGDIDAANLVTSREQRAGGLGRVQWLVAQFVGGQQQRSHHLDPIGPASALRLAQRRCTSRHASACRRAASTDVRCRSTGEDEPQVAIAFGQWHHRTPRRNTDVETDHSFDGEGAFLSRHVVEYPRRADREHHHARCL